MQHVTHGCASFTVVNCLCVARPTDFSSYPLIVFPQWNSFDFLRGSFRFSSSSRMSLLQSLEILLRCLSANRWKPDPAIQSGKVQQNLCRRRCMSIHEIAVCPSVALVHVAAFNGGRSIACAMFIVVASFCWWFVNVNTYTSRVSPHTLQPILILVSFLVSYAQVHIYGTTTFFFP